ncbi:MAG: sialidase family protein [Nitrososphaeraceae archaeon]
MLMRLVSIPLGLSEGKEEEKKDQRSQKYHIGWQTLVLFVLPLTICISVSEASYFHPVQVKGQTSHEVLPLHLSTDTMFAYDPQMTVSESSNIFIVWTGAPTMGSADTNIYFSRSIDHGKTFTPPVILSTFGNPMTGPILSPGIQQEARIATSGSNVYIIWSDYSAGPAQIVFVKSVDNGTTFTPPVPLGTVFAAAGETRLSASMNNVYVAWIGSADDVHAGSILSRSSNDFGASFGKTTSVSGPGVASMPELAAAIGKDSVYITWFNTTIREDGTVLNNDILFSKSSDAGHNFSKPKNLSQTPNQLSVRPQLYVVTASENHSNGTINKRSSSLISGPLSTTSLGLSDNSSENIKSSNLSETPEESAAGNYRDTENEDRVYLAWLESGAGGNVDIGNIFFSMSLDGGTTFTAPMKLSNNTQGSIRPDTDPRIVASADGKNVFVVWSHAESAGTEEEVVKAAGVEDPVTHSTNMIAPHNETFNGNTITNSYLQNSEIYNDDGEQSLSRFQKVGVIINDADKVIDDMETSTQTSSGVGSGSNRNLSSEIFMAPSNDGGRNFGKAFVISDSVDFSVDPSVMILPDSMSDVLTMWTDNSTSNLGIFNIFLKTYMANNFMSQNENVGQTNQLRTPGSVIRPQMAAIQADDTNSTLGSQNERKNNIIIAWTEYESGSYGVFLSRVNL